MNMQDFGIPIAMTTARPRKRTGSKYSTSMSAGLYAPRTSSRCRTSETVRDLPYGLVATGQSTDIVRLKSTSQRFVDRDCQHKERLVGFINRRVGTQLRAEFPSELTSDSQIGLQFRVRRIGRAKGRSQAAMSRIVRAGNLEHSGFILRKSATVLESFRGFVHGIDGDTAFVTLTSDTGEELIGEYPARELEAIGIRERRRFICQTVKADGEVEVRFQSIPDIEVTPEEEAAIHRELDELISGGELDGDY